MASAEHELARTLLEREAGGVSGTADELAAAAERACGKLRTHLARVMGSAGFEAILRRALSLAQGEFPNLAAVEPRMDGERCLDGLSDAVGGRPPAEVAEALVALFAAFLGLLISLVGRELAMRLLTPVWPAAPGADGDGSNE